MLSAALEAGAAGLAFAPVTGPADTDYLVWSPTSLARVDSPFGAELVVRAVAPDVAFLHAALADEWGNAALGTPVGEAPLAMAAAARTVVIAERIGTLAEVSALGIDVPGVLVDCVCETPGAAQPDGVPGLYARDIHAYEQYAQR
jgi:glutaconate CoA-transferase subunit A